MARIRRKVTQTGHNNKIIIMIALFVIVLNVSQTLKLKNDLLGKFPWVNLALKSTSSSTSTTSDTSSLRRTPYFKQKPSQVFQLIPPRQANGAAVKTLVKPGDFIYYKDPERWDSAPIVIESHKLVFFSIPKVGCTVWKQLFRRMMGYDDWKKQDGETFLPHNPEVNGLKYLYDYPVEKASEIMSSPEWTRAVMVRDPKQRFLSAFLDKSVSNDHHHIINRCCPDSSCVEAAQTPIGFLDLCHVCEDDHWRAQHDRMESKYWPYIDWVGHVDSADKDAKELLQRVGAWEQYGASGWGSPDNDRTIFQSKEVAGAGDHATFSEWQVWKWYNPEVEEKVEKFFSGDYENPLFNFTRGVCITCDER